MVPIKVVVLWYQPQTLQGYERWQYRGTTSGALLHLIDQWYTGTTRAKGMVPPNLQTRICQSSTLQAKFQIKQNTLGKVREGKRKCIKPGEGTSSIETKRGD